MFLMPHRKKRGKKDQERWTKKNPISPNGGKGGLAANKTKQKKKDQGEPSVNCERPKKGGR